MARHQILEFWVKPQGIFASKRYARVFVDDNGNVSVENVPGKEAINLDSIDDYKSSNFPFGEGNNITSFCNTDTFTNYRILASRTRPWVTVQTDLNAPQCGYLTPLPTPAVPPNPFGTSPYDLFAFYHFCDVKKNGKTVNIYRHNYNGSATIVPVEILKGGESPVIYNYTSGDDKFAPIRACECIFNFIAEVNFQLSALYSFDEREFLLEVVDDETGNIDFKGFITPDNATEPFANPPYEVSIRATDGLGGLKNIPYPIPVGSSTNIKQKFLHILAFALSQTNLNLDIFTGCNLYAKGMAAGIGDDPLELSEVSPLRMTAENGSIYSCYEALEAVCRQFGASISQVNGSWQFIRVNEFSRGSIRYRTYDYTARRKVSGTLSTIRLAGNKSQDVLLSNHDHNTTTGNAYKLVKVIQDYGRAPDVIYNGNFEDWDGQNFRYWTRYGGINVQRVQKTITAYGGVTVPVEDYACRFMERADSGKWLEDVPNWINKGQTVRISMNIGKTDGIYDLKVRFKIGQFYLTNANEAFEWVTSLSTTTIRVDNRVGDIFSFAISIAIPEAPVSGDMVMQIYGFTKLAAISSGSVPPSGARPARGSENGVGGSVTTYYELDDYTPIDIDNLAISTQVSEDKRVTGSINVSSQNGFYTNRPDDIHIIWGEFKEGSLDPTAVNGSFVPARPSRNGSDSGNSPQQQLQTIYLSNGDLATGWYEYGESTTAIPIGLCLARAILKAYQKSFIFLDGSFTGDNITYIDTFNIIVPNDDTFRQRYFVWQNVTFDVKKRTAKGKMAELFSNTILSNDYTAPQVPSSTNNGASSSIDDNGLLTPIFQNPNLPTNLNSIFTQQFTPEFT